MDLVLILTLLVLQLTPGFCRTIEHSQELEELGYEVISDRLAPVLLSEEMQDAINQIKAVQIHPLTEKTLDAQGLLDIMSLLQKNKENKSPLAIILATPDIVSEITPKMHSHKHTKDKHKSDDRSIVQDVKDLNGKELESEFEGNYRADDSDLVGNTIKFGDYNLETENVGKVADIEVEDKAHKLERVSSDSSYSSGSLEESESNVKVVGKEINVNANPKESIADRRGLETHSKNSKVSNSISHEVNQISDVNINVEGINYDHEPENKLHSYARSLKKGDLHILEKMLDNSDITNIGPSAEAQDSRKRMGQSNMLEADKEVDTLISNSELTSDDFYEDLLQKFAYIWNYLTDAETNEQLLKSGELERKDRLQNKIKNTLLKSGNAATDLTNKRDIAKELRDFLSVIENKQHFNELKCEEMELSRDRDRHGNNNTYHFSFFFHRK